MSLSCCLTVCCVVLSVEGSDGCDNVGAAPVREKLERNMNDSDDQIFVQSLEAVSSAYSRTVLKFEQQLREQREEIHQLRALLQEATSNVRMLEAKVSKLERFKRAVVSATAFDSGGDETSTLLNASIASDSTASFQMSRPLPSTSPSSTHAQQAALRGLGGEQSLLLSPVRQSRSTDVHDLTASSLGPRAPTANGGVRESNSNATSTAVGRSTTEGRTGATGSRDFIARARLTLSAEEFGRLFEVVRRQRTPALLLAETIRLLGAQHELIPHLRAQLALPEHTAQRAEQRSAAPAATEAEDDLSSFAFADDTFDELADDHV
jgi:hypothetical protein